jgi:hypothetical protein
MPMRVLQEFRANAVTRMMINFTPTACGFGQALAKQKLLPYHANVIGFTPPAYSPLSGSQRKLRGFSRIYPLPRLWIYRFFIPFIQVSGNLEVPTKSGRHRPSTMPPNRIERSGRRRRMFRRSFRRSLHRQLANHQHTLHRHRLRSDHRRHPHPARRQHPAQDFPQSRHRRPRHRQLRKPSSEVAITLR